MPATVESLGCQIILANTFHLMLRPGSELIEKVGGKQGLHTFMQWDKPILTDSGGFQVFSLGDINQINDQGVVFRSPHDGSRVDLTPQRSIQVQNELGADIIMAFDDCPPAKIQEDEAGEPGAPGPSGESQEDAAPENAFKPGHTSSALRHAVGPAEYEKRVKESCERSIRWLAQCKEAHQRSDDQSLFGIVQGGTDLDQRTWCADRTVDIDLPGYAIGGVAVGEGYEELKRVVEHTAPLLPNEKPRYLMGVGYEQDIYTAVRAGVDMFDCVLPTRNGRNANAFTRLGQMRLKNARYTDDPRPIDETCDCPACGGGFSRSYLRHLFLAGEMLGPILISMHNLHHFQRLMVDIRAAIAEDDFTKLELKWPVVTGRRKYPED